MNKNIVLAISVFLILTVFVSLKLAHAQSSLKLTHARLYIPTSSYTTILKDNDNYYLLAKDYLSSTKAIVNGSGAVSQSETYYPYGMAQQTSDNQLTDKLFTSQRKIDNLDVYNFGARFYSPLTGLFIQPDTVEGPNRFSYANNDPIFFNDPTGHLSCDYCKSILNPMFPDNPDTPQNIPDIGTYVATLAKRNGIYDLGSLALKAFDTVTGVGYRPENDPIANKSNQLNKYISRSTLMTDQAVAMVMPIGGELEGAASAFKPGKPWVLFDFDQTLATRFEMEMTSLDAEEIATLLKQPDTYLSSDGLDIIQLRAHAKEIVKDLARDHNVGILSTSTTESLSAALGPNPEFAKNFCLICGRTGVNNPQFNLQLLEERSSRGWGGLPKHPDLIMGNSPRILIDDSEEAADLWTGINQGFIKVSREGGMPGDQDLLRIPSQVRKMFGEMQ